MSTQRDLDKLTEELLAAAKTEQPSDAVKDRVLAAVLEEPPAGDSARATSRRMWWIGGLSLLAIGVGVGVGSGALREEPVPVPPVVVVEAPRPPPAPVNVEPPPVEAPVPQPAPTPEPAPVEPPAPPPPIASKKPKQPPPTPTPDPIEEDIDQLAREVALLDEARSTLTSAPTKALDVLERHAREFPTGALRSEADLLRLEALVKAERRSEASKLAKRLSAQHPSGPVAERIQRILEGTSP